MWIAFGIALVVSIFLLPGVILFLRRAQILDVPEARSSHAVPTPRGAGIALAPGAVLAVVATVALPLLSLAAVFGFCVVGGVDDWRRLPAGGRLVAQLGLGALASLPIVLLTGGTGITAGLTMIAGILVFTIIVNATNFMDGINGITGLHGIVLGCGLGVTCAVGGAALVGPTGLALAGVSLAFLPWNWGKEAKVFLGDSGSYLIGAMLASLVLAAAIIGPGWLIAVAPLAIYLVDTGAALARRILRRDPLLTAHRGHVYQRMTSLGWSHSRSAIFVAGCSAICTLAALGAATNFIPAATLIVIVLATSLGYLATPRLVTYRTQ